MKALISPTETVETGFRVAEVSSQSFEVASPLFWVDCADDVVADAYWYDPITQSCQLTTAPEPVNAPANPSQPQTQGAQTL